MNSGYIYLISYNGAIKIGSAIDYKKRLEQNFKKYNGAEFIHCYMVDNYQYVELKLHDIFNNKRFSKNAEWFGLNHKDIIKLCFIMRDKFNSIDIWDLN